MATNEKARPLYLGIEKAKAVAIKKSRRHIIEPNPPRPPFRVHFGAGTAAQVKGWPKKGGMFIIGHCTGVELDFLQLDRFSNLLRPMAGDEAQIEEEEQYCNRSKAHPLRVALLSEKQADASRLQCDN
jgi:hypothetical protein